MKPLYSIALFCLFAWSVFQASAQEDGEVATITIAAIVDEALFEGESRRGETAVGVQPAFDFVLMEPDVEVVFITTGGAEVRADWSKASTLNLKAAFRSQIEKQGYTLINFDTETKDSEPLEQLLLLYDIVSNSTHIKMPHKGKGRYNNTDLTLGENAALLKDIYNTDKAVFVDHSSLITSSGVMLTSAFIGAATKTVPVVPTAQETSGYVIDLESGNFTASHIALTGDVRKQDGADRVAARVMKKLPLE